MPNESEILEEKRMELSAISDEHAEAVQEMNAARVRLDERIAAVNKLNKRLAEATEEYRKLELARA